jgi:hypothetical protein
MLERRSALRRGDSDACLEICFYDFNVWTSRKRVEKLRYMHRNPVKRGLVESPELWRWSSYRSYAWGRADQRMGHSEDEDAKTGGVEPTVSAVVVPMSRKARDMGHPRLDGAVGR